MRISREEYYEELLTVVKKRSECRRKQVGAIIVNDGRICMTGYNGMPSGYAGTCCDPSELTFCTNTIHAEMNAIGMCAKKGISVEGCSMWVTMSPCLNCAKVIASSGIVEVVYLEEYRDRSGIEYLKMCGIECKKKNDD